MHTPTTEHWTLVKRLLSYLCGTPNDGLQLYCNSPISLHAFSDALHAYSDVVGRATQTTSPPQELILSILVAILSLGAPKSRKPLPVHLLKLNIDLLQTLLLS